MSWNIKFPQDENSPDDHIVRSLQELGDQILWRKSTQQAKNHFELKRDKETGIVKEDDASLFKLITQSSFLVLEDNGKNFLIFFFSHPARLAFCNKLDELRESIAVSFHPKQLLNLINSSSILRSKFMKLELSDKQNYGEYATHYGLFYQKKSSGKYCDLDDDVLEALNNCSKINPDTQKDNYNLVDEVINECSRDILDLLKQCISNKELSIKDQNRYHKCINELLKNFPELKQA